MPEDTRKQTLVERIWTYHEVDKPRDGEGGTLSVVKIAELGEGVACAQDSLGEFDIFFDTDDWELANVPKGRYGIMLKSAQEGITRYGKMREDWGMVCVVQDRWNPASYLGGSAFFQALEAMHALLRPINPSCYLYDTPKLIGLIQSPIHPTPPTPPTKLLILN